MNFKKLIVVFVGLLTSQFTVAQTSVELSLQDVISMAKDSSLTAFRYKNMYLSSYWTFKTFKANRLPSLTLDLTPVSYNRQLISRYDSENDIDIYRQQKSYLASGGLTLRQNFDPLGGTFFVKTSLDYLRYFGANTYNQFSTVPIIIGYSHDMFGYNQFRWDRKIEPMKFEKAKLEYLYNTEQISILAVNYFFQLALSQSQYRNAVVQKQKCDSLYQMGELKYNIASITKSDLMTLKLDVMNAQNTINEAEVSVKRATLSLTSFLGLDRNTEITVLLPQSPEKLDINIALALEMMRQNSYMILEKSQQITQAEMSLDYAKKSNRLTASIQASVGYNQEAEKLEDAYIDPMRRDVISVSLTVPILDWGVRKGQRNQAENALAVARIEQSQCIDELEQNVINSVGELGSRYMVLNSSVEALQIAREVYDQNILNFKNGSCDITTLSSSQSRLLSAQNQYITSMQQYWSCYYDLRAQTLYDFYNNISLSEQFNFDNLR